MLSRYVQSSLGSASLLGRVQMASVAGTVKMTGNDRIGIASFPLLVIYVFGAFNTEYDTRSRDELYRYSRGLTHDNPQFMHSYSLGLTYNSPPPFIYRYIDTQWLGHTIGLQFTALWWAIPTQRRTSIKKNNKEF